MVFNSQSNNTWIEANDQSAREWSPNVAIVTCSRGCVDRNRDLGIVPGTVFIEKIVQCLLGLDVPSPLGVVEVLVLFGIFFDVEQEVRTFRVIPRRYLFLAHVTRRTVPASVER